MLATAAAARAGLDAERVAARARAARETTKIWFAVDTLEYLRRGGRIGSVQAWVGGALKVKPILTLEDELVPIERVRTGRRAFERMVDYLRSRHYDGATTWFIQHIRAPEEADRLVEEGRRIFGTEPLFVSEIGPVIGAHVGPRPVRGSGHAPVAARGALTCAAISSAPSWRSLRLAGAAPGAGAGRHRRPGGARLRPRSTTPPACSPSPTTASRVPDPTHRHRPSPELRARRRCRATRRARRSIPRRSTPWTASPPAR